MLISIALYPAPATESPTPFETRRVTWGELLDLLSDCEETECGDSCVGSKCPSKDGQGWSAVRFKDGAAYRSKENVDAVCAAVFDVDEWSADDWQVKLEAMELALAGTSYCLHSTHASHPDFLKLRLVVELSRECSPAEYARLWPTLVDTFQIPTKRSLGNPDRMYFLPSVPRGVEFVFYHEDGKPADVDSFLARAPATTPKTAASAPIASGVVGGESVDMAALREAVAGDKWGSVVLKGEPIGRGPGRNHDALLACMNELARKTLAFAPEAVLELLEQGSFSHPDHYGTPPADEFRRMFYPAREFWVSAATERKEAAASAVKALRDKLRAPMPKTDPVDTPPAAFAATDTGNAERLAARYAGNLLFCAGRWLAWDGRRFTEEGGEALVHECGKETIRSISAEAADPGMWEHAFKSESEARRRAMVKLASYDTALQAFPGEFDAGRWLLNLSNGTLDLKTGTLRPHDRKDRLTKLLRLQYDAGAQCPLWATFLERVLPDAALVSFLQRFVGYCLTGDVREQVFAFLWGEGRNGKSTFCSVLKALMGEYAAPAPPHLLEAKHNPQHPADIADLVGKRLVISQETDEGKRFDEALIKYLTGGDALKARKMRQDYFEFEPTHKILLSGNHRPPIRGLDFAMWRRVLLVPFTVRIPEEEMNHNLLSQLLSELPGVLAWAVRGCLEWQEKGLRPPEAVRAATASYQREADILENFIEECCVRDERAEMRASHLYQRYRSWCESTGERLMSQNAFGRRLGEKGLMRQVKADGVHWHGLRFRTSSDSHLTVVPKPEGAESVKGS